MPRRSGEVVGSYELLHRIDEGLDAGGMGQVWKADDKGLARYVALKFPREDLLADPTFAARFLDEGRALARLAHPNVARVLEASSDGAGPYLVLELVEGPSLAAWLSLKQSQGERATPTEAAAIVVQLCRALAAVHEQGIVHRDVKPANILLAGTGRQVKLIDFGAAVLPGSDVRTRLGGLVATPAYMAPEQAAERRDRIGPAADVFSAAVVAIERVRFLLRREEEVRGERPDDGHRVVGGLVVLDDEFVGQVVLCRQ